MLLAYYCTLGTTKDNNNNYYFFLSLYIGCNDVTNFDSFCGSISGNTTVPYNMATTGIEVEFSDVL